jgi:hypothetical protein
MRDRLDRTHSIQKPNELILVGLVLIMLPEGGIA